MGRVKFEDNTAQAKAAIMSAARAGVEAASLIIEAQAKALTPVDTGGLRDSMGHNVTVNGSEVIGKIGSPLMYAIYQEFGTGEFAENGAGRKGGWSYTDPEGVRHFTRGNRPRKMLRNAFALSHAQVVTTLESALKGVGG